MKTFYRWIVRHSDGFILLALLSPVVVALTAYGMGGDPLHAAAYTFMALVMAGALFGMAGLAVCLFALAVAILSLAFGF